MKRNGPGRLPIGSRGARGGYAGRPTRRTALSLLLMLSLPVVWMAGCAPDPPEVAADTLYVREVEGNVFDTAPVRGEVKALELVKGAFTYQCMECHRDFDSPIKERQLQGEHTEIAKRFDHGLNTRCQNCHHPSNRNAYVDHEGNETPSTEPARLCSKCHGPTFRDWEHGVHGRQNGYWAVDQGPRTKLLCIQCHDPHRPKFGMMKPDPAPVRSRLVAARGGAGH